MGTTSLVEKSEKLFELEKKLQELFQSELKNIFEIGAVLKNIKDNKLYRYKDTVGTYTWSSWARDFFGSHDTAQRYISIFEVFMEKRKELFNKVKTMQASKLYEIIPILSREDINEKDAEEIVELARESPSTRELKIALKQRDMGLEEITVEGAHEHKMSHRHYLVCVTCEKYEECNCPKIEIKQ